jgi:plastocyanin
MNKRHVLAAPIIAALLLSAAFARAQTAAIIATVNDDRGQPLEHAVVVAVPIDGVMHLTGRAQGVVDQVNKEFLPRVTAIVVGTSIVFPNHDDVRHQVYSFSPVKRFELPLYAGQPAAPVLFDKPGIVVLGCNIHDWMVGYVYVSESPYFAMTGKDGKAVLSDLPPREYTVRVWHPQSEASEDATHKAVDLSHARSAHVAWALISKPETRVRRAPTAERGGRY